MDLSVILPFRNAEKTLEKAVQSILNQTYSKFELVLVDNNSEDGSSDLAKHLIQGVNNAILIHEEKKGVSHAMNTGLKMATGSYLARMDADDEWYPQKLQIQMRYLKEHEEVDVIGTQVDYASFEGYNEGLAYYVDWSNKATSHQEIIHNMFVESPLVNPSIVFKKSLIQTHGPYLQLNVPEDYEMFLRWHMVGANFRKVEKKLMRWNDSSGRLTRTHEMYSADAFNRVKCKYLAKWLLKNGHREVWIWGAGRKTRRKADELLKNGISIVGYVDLKSGFSGGKKCIHFEELLKEKRFVVPFVNSRGAGEEIRAWLLQNAFREGEDFVMAA